MKALRRLAATAAAVNAAAMTLYLPAHDWRVIAITYAGATAAGYAWLELREEENMSIGYRELATRLRWEIREQHYQPGDRLPSIADLAASFDTTKTTVRRALAVLAGDNIVKIIHGRGVFVTNPDISRRPQSWVERAILREVIEREQIGTTRDIAILLSTSESTVQRALRRLTADGILTKTGGRYVRS